MSDLASFVPPPSSQAPRAFGLRMSMPPSIAHNYTPLTPVAFLLRAALVCPNALAVIHAERGVQYTYAQWAARCLSLTFALQTTPGFAPGARVAVISPNNPMILEAHNAILAAGAIINPLNIRNSPAEIAYVLGHSGATIILCDSEYAHLLPKNLAKGITVIISNDSGGRDPKDPYEAYLAGGRREWEAQERSSKKGLLGWELITHIEDENAPAALCYTSGTTGKPKGVITTHRGSFLGAVSNAFEAGLGPTSVYAALLPYFHACGWTFPWAVTAAFATAYTMRKVDNDAIWDALLNAGVTHYAGAPTVQIGIVNHPKAKKLPRVVRVAVAASAPTAQLLGMMESLNLVPVHVYGLTETYGPVTRRYTEPTWAAMSTEERARLMARQGHGYLTSDEARVCRVPPEGADPQATPLEDVARDGKEMGEIMLRGNMVMKEYYNDKEATRKTFRDGWFCTGDLAVRMPGGELNILDRGKDVIISGGENISSLMVESEMATHPAVLECCVVGRKHEKWAEVGHAFVVLKQGQSADMETLKAHCRERMSKFAVPMYFDFVKELPKTSTGKVQKNVLRARVAETPQAKL